MTRRANTWTGWSSLVLAGFLAVVSHSTALAQQIRHVPSEYPTIQAGIDAAETNDTVLVAEGGYEGAGFVDLDFRGKAITVRGENGRANIYDQGFGNVFVHFVSGEGAESVLEGFCVFMQSGAGLHVSNSSPTVRNCEFGTDGHRPIELTNSNAALSNIYVYGSSNSGSVITDGMPTLTGVRFDAVGLLVRDSDGLFTDCSVSDHREGFRSPPMVISGGAPRFLRCEFSRNITGDGGYGANGGGLKVTDSFAAFTDCDINDNIVYDHIKIDGAGGGAFVTGGAVHFENCRFLRNWAGTSGGGVSAGGAATFSGCRFEGNRAGGLGGGLSGGVSIFGCYFERNSAQSGGGAYSRGDVVRTAFRNNTAWGFHFAGGGGLNSQGNYVVECLFEGNLATNGDYEDGDGGGMKTEIQTSVRGCTFVSNSAEGEGAAIYLAKGARFANSVIRDNVGDSQVNPGASVTWSNIQGGYPGEGNIDADPRFVDPANGDYRLGDGSPCIDAGNNALVPPESEFDLDGLPRFVNDPGMPDMGEGRAPIVDMGCYEFQTSSTGLNLALRTSCPDGGPARIGWANGSPGRTGVVLLSPDMGTVRIPNRYPCAGTQLGLASSGLRLAWQGRNDADGGRVINTTAPPSACGQFIQFLDLSTCNVSEVLRIE